MSTVDSHDDSIICLPLDSRSSQLWAPYLLICLLQIVPLVHLSPEKWILPKEALLLALEDAAEQSFFVAVLETTETFLKIKKILLIREEEHIMHCQKCYGFD